MLINITILVIVFRIPTTSSIPFWVSLQKNIYIFRYNFFVTVKLYINQEKSFFLMIFRQGLFVTIQIGKARYCFILDFFWRHFHKLSWKSFFQWHISNQSFPDRARHENFCGRNFYHFLTKLVVTKNFFFCSDHSVTFPMLHLLQSLKSLIYLFLEDIINKNILVTPLNSVILI